MMLVNNNSFADLKKNNYSIRFWILWKYLNRYNSRYKMVRLKLYIKHIFKNEMHVLGNHFLYYN